MRISDWSSDVCSSDLIGPDDDMEQRRREILDRVDAMDSGRGVVVLTDMFGGTPSNLAISILDRPGVEVIAGVNLPMLIKLASVRVGGTLVEAAVAGRAAGRKYISIASEVLVGSARCHGGRIRVVSPRGGGVAPLPARRQSEACGGGKEVRSRCHNRGD